MGQDLKDDGGKDIKKSYSYSTKDLGIRYLVGRNADRRKRIDHVTIEIKEKRPQSKKALAKIYKSNGVVKYKGEWILKEMAKKRAKRDREKGKAKR